MKKSYEKPILTKQTVLSRVTAAISGTNGATSNGG